MKKQIVLTSGDIKQIIADSFNVCIDNVDLQCFTEWEGYGTSERQVPKVKATVEVPMNEERLELPKDFIPCPKSIGSKEYVCPVCLSLLNEVTDNVCPSCGREMAWQKVKV